MSILRDYQEEAIDLTRASIKSGKKRPIIVAATGAGKTTIAAHIAKSAHKNGRHVFFMAHRKELIEQCSARFDEEGLDHGIIKAKNPRVNNLPVQVVSKDTLIRRLSLIPSDEKCILIIDEAHRGLGASYLKIIDAFEEQSERLTVIGLTATPFRTDNRGLGEVYDDIIVCLTMQQGIDRKFLVPPTMFSTPRVPDFSSLKKTKGDYREKELEKIFDNADIIGDIVNNWKRKASDRLTVVYASSVRHSKNLAEAFSREGVSACHIDGNTEEEIRSSMLDAFAGKSGERYQVICNCGVLTEGWDCPEVSCVVLARKTASRALYIQMAGRGARTYKGKVDYILLDHGDNFKTHGFPQDNAEFTLDGLVAKKKDSEEKFATLKTCSECFAVFKSQPRCPSCNHFHVPKIKTYKEIQAELIEMKPGKRLKCEKEIYKELLAKGKKENRGINWAATQFKKITGRFPKFKGLGPKKEWDKTFNFETNKFEWKLKKVTPDGQ